MTGVTAIYPQTPLSMRLECSPGADLTADPATYTWTDITADLSGSVPIVHTRGSQDEQSESNSESTFGLRNNSARYTVDNPLSDMYPNLGLNTPFRFSTNTGDGSGWNVEWIQYLSEAVDDWPSGTPHLCRAMITCAGSFRRFGQGEVLKGALERAITADTPTDYWKLEDPAGTLTPINQTGTAVMAIRSGTLDFRSLDSAPGGGGTSAATSFNNGSTRIALNRPLPWAIEFTYYRPPDASADGKIIGLVDVNGTSLGGANVNVGLGSVQPTSGWQHWIMAGEQVDATTYRVNKWLNGVVQTPAASTGTQAVLTAVTLASDDYTATDTIGVGHLAIYANDGTTLVDHYNAVQGYTGEMAHNRLTRICGEQSVPFATTATVSTLMGPQPLDTFLGILRDCESTDHGQLDDSQGLVEYRALSEFYNQASKLTVDAARPNRLFLPHNPVTDDQKRRNKVTASSPDGTSFTVSNLADIAKVGSYEGTTGVNVELPTQLVDHAGWFANNVGVAPGKRYPGIILDFLRAPDMLADFRSMRLSDRITIINPPRQQNRTDIDLILPGWSTVIEGRGRTYQLAANCAPYWPYRVAVTDSATFGKIDSGSSTLTAAVAAIDTSFSVTTTNPLDVWVTGSGLAITLLIAGEAMLVDTISGASSPQTFSGITRAANAIHKPHTAGTEVHVQYPFKLAL